MEYIAMKNQELYWGMHFCNSRMFKTIAKVEMYIRGRKAEQINVISNKEEHTQYYMTEHGQIFKFDKVKFKSYELDLQDMVWFQNQDFVKAYFEDYMKYTEIDEFIDCYEYRKEA